MKTKKTNTSKKIIVGAVKCPNCKCLIYSRARHDYHSCKCGSVSVDGGREYFRVGFKTKIAPDTCKYTVFASEQSLYDDWKFGIDKFGLVDEKSVIKNDKKNIKLK